MRMFLQLAAQAARITTRAATLAALVCAPASMLGAQGAQGTEEGLLVVYGPQANSREGDADLSEQIFFSLPAGLGQRVYVRIFDPETAGSGDFTYGGNADSKTAFRIFGGEGARSAARLPSPVEDGARGRGRLAPGADATLHGPGKLIRERIFDRDRATDGRWVAIGAVRARQGEVIDSRAWFRLEVQGVAGNDGNGYSVDISLNRDRARAPQGLELVSYVATLRWPGKGPATEVVFDNPAGATRLTVQNFDAANGELNLTERYRDIPLKASGQNDWASQTVTAQGDELAVTLRKGGERPNDVTLMVFDDAGNPLPLHMPPRRLADPARPTPRGAGRPLADCSSVAFDGKASAGRGPLRHLWDFGDGTSATGAVLAHRYSQPGRYTARLNVTQAGRHPGRGATLEIPVHIRPRPRAAAGDAITVAPGQPVLFDGTGSEPSDAPISRYTWEFGDGSAAKGAQARKTYDTPGLYRAILRVEDDSNHPCNFGVATREVTVNFAPVAEAGTDLSAITGQTIRLSAAASYDVDGQITSHSWDMGDGTTLAGAEISHVYTAPGTYRPVLTVIDDSGVSNDTTTDLVTIRVNSPPVPDIARPDRHYGVGEAITLDAGGSVDEDGVILSYAWDFGDGASGNGRRIDYAWATPGTYDVTLTVTDNSATASAVQSITQTVTVNAPPVADAGPDQLVTASDVTFDGTGSADSDGSIADWAWDFGDGSTGHGATPTHAYVRPGSYDVALVVTDDSTAPLNTHRDTMRVTVNALPIADAGPPQTVAPGQEFVLGAGGSLDPDGTIAGYEWRLPGGATSQAPRLSTRIDTPGLYRIGLTVSDDFPGGPATDSAEVLITVNAPPVAQAGADRLVAPGDEVTFDGGQSYDPDGRIAAWQWSFDDLDQPITGQSVTRSYDKPGVWSAQLSVTDDSGMTNGSARDDLTVRVNHAPVAEAGPEIHSETLAIALDASASSDADGDMLIYTWDTGDGTPPVSGKVVDHIYARPGIYPVTLRVDDGTGLANATAIDATTVTINTRPVANAGGNRDVCSGDPILFDASKSHDEDGDLLRFEWDFGDGSGARIINPTKTYERPGTYPVTLTVRDESGTAQGTHMDRIAAIVREGPIADAGPDRTVCANAETRLDGSGSTDADGAVNAYSWSFGDGNTASGDRPVHSFSRPGTHTVTLTITGEARGACSPLDTDTATYTVVPAPGLDIEMPERAALNAPVRFAATLGDADSGQVAGYVWRFSDGTEKTGAAVTHSFAEPGTQWVSVATTLKDGHPQCSELSARRTIAVNTAPRPAIAGPRAVTAGETVVFDAGGSTDSDGAITGFAWDFGDGGTATGVLGAHRFDVAGSHDVTVSVTDDAGVTNSTASITQRVQVAPAPRAGLAAPPALCAGRPHDWVAGAPAGTSVIWDFGDGTTTTEPRISHSYARPGLYPVTLTMDDGLGLVGSLRREQVHARVNRPPMALAGPDRVICPGEPMVLNAGASGDLDGTITRHDWTFSDGVTLTGPEVTRSFDRPGAYEVTLSVTDDSGAACGVSTDSARILINGAPRIDAGPDRGVPVGAAHDYLIFDATDARDPDGHGLRILWDFGDGTTASGAIARHGYSAPGDYTVTVTARDATGLACGVASDTARITALERRAAAE